MRWVHLCVIAAFALVTIVFAFQNLTLVTMSLFGFSARLPLAFLVIVIYLLGTATGGSVLALLHRSYLGSRGEP